MEVCQKFFLGFALDVQAEDVAGLDGLEVFAALLGFEAEALEHGGEGGVGRGNVGVDFDDVRFVFFRQSLCTVKKLREGLTVIQIAHGAAAAVH